MPYDKPMLSLSQAQAAIAAMVEKAMEEANRPMAMAVVDDSGNLLCYARMDRCRVIPAPLATKKAYTAAITGVDTAAYADRLKIQGRNVSEMGDPNMAAVQGGVVIARPDGAILGGIGVSGRTGQEDEEVAKLGAAAI